MIILFNKRIHLIYKLRKQNKKPTLKFEFKWLMKLSKIQSKYSIA